MTLDLSRWYAGTSLIVIGSLAGLAIGAFWVSLAGRSVFRDSLLES